MITYNDKYSTTTGLLSHSLPLFHKLKMLNILDIHKQQVCKFVFESVNGLGPSKSILQFTRASEIHDHNTRFAEQGIFFNNGVRTNRYGLKALKIHGTKVWVSIPINIRESRTIKSFNFKYKRLLIGSYLK